MDNRHVVIVGGGVIGSAVAYFLAAHPRFQGRVTVLERDPSYTHASSALSASSIRQQFSTPLNIQMSQFGIAFLRDLHQHLAVDGELPELALSEHGYLYLATDGGAATLRENHEIQRAAQVDVALLNQDALKQKFPWQNVDDLAIGSLGLSGEGWFDGYALLMAFRRKARSQGVTYLQADAQGFEHEKGRVTGVRLQNGTVIKCDVAVNAAGAWARPLLAGTGFDLPVVGRVRTVFVVSSPAQTPACPLIIDPSGLWFRPEGQHWICGLPPDNDPDDAALEADYEQFDTAWQIMANRVPAFEALRMQRAWAGYYEYNVFDQNAVIGPHPQLPNLMLANGFSGHGMQHAPATGRGIAELLVDGAYSSLDLSPLSAQRLLDGRPLLEKNVI
ncbi:NAD(P)/FAD-dependent oxidoreductase [Undibacterium umbellatum]|uniref:FAD-binding oxidoreductase n=1 Tax=Undibacterium umbellatum TaxID=2762300 RepID=A0ABR6ZAE0_9BURK|nr:FAD-binding oxidoreductase [Undibacterium umbellatum]MBC3908281.1 FAD-binding oxidoreductase [Undibacterium umbellatum]